MASAQLEKSVAIAYVDASYRMSVPCMGIGGLVLVGRKPVHRFTKLVPLDNFPYQPSSNVGEYLAVRHAAVWIYKAGYRMAHFLTDSSVVAHQLDGQFTVKAASLRGLHASTKKVLDAFTAWTITKIPRERNEAADLLAGLATQKHSWQYAEHLLRRLDDG